MLFFLFFFSGDLVEAIARPICMKYGTNVCSCLGFIILFRNLGKFKKPGHDEQKTSWNRSIFHPHRHVHAHCIETVQRLCYKLQTYHLEIHTFQKMYLWPLRTVWFRSLFCFIEHHYWAISMLINVMRIVRSHSPHVATVVSPWRRLNYIVLGDSWSCKIDVKVMALDFFWPSIFLAVNILSRAMFCRQISFIIFNFFWPSIFRAALCCADEFFVFWQVIHGVDLWSVNLEFVHRGPNKNGNIY